MKKLILAVAPILLTTVSTVFAYEKGNWVMRVGMTNIAPDDSSDNVNVGGADLGVGVNVDSNTQWVYTLSISIARSLRLRSWLPRHLVMILVWIL